MKQKIIYIPVNEIRPNPAQPRRFFEQDALKELSGSIMQYGVLQPLNVRKAGKQYELISGERRLRAAKLAGIAKVPCIVNDVDMYESSLIAMVENLQRRDLDYIDEAEGISRLIRSYGMTQDECAVKLGKSQSAIANKLRILRLSPEVLQSLREHNLTERHARALLRLPANDTRMSVIMKITEDALTVAQTDALIESIVNAPSAEYENPLFSVKRQEERSSAAEFIEALLNEPARADTAGRKPGRKFVVKDLRIFINTITKSLDTLKRSGIDAEYAQDELETETLLTIRIPKAA
jgi:ParB family chromosome partitioning protein